jgi:Zn-dependent M28 family amino/carboxypeptidase
LTFLAAACARNAEQKQPSPDNLWADARAAVESITPNELLQHIRVLSSDEFEGRLPGTRGEELTVAYLTDQFKQLGLQAGNPDGTYVQNVPLVGITGKPTLSINVGGNAMFFTAPTEFTAVTRQVKPQIDVENSEIVFVGYGVVAPEYGWDDYKGVDVRGKTILMLINDPAIPDANDASRLDANMFKGRAMTYYGRWTYKYEIAAEKGAAAAIIVHETGPAGYPYEVVANGWSGERFDIKNPTGNAERAKIESWIHLDKAKQLLSAAGQDFDALKRAALRKDFQPVALNAKATFHLTNTIREVQSKNVIAKLEGDKKDEFIIYTAHWDHFGRDPNLKGDQIFNGAADNASGTSALIEMAQAFTKLGHKPERSILFMAVTAEEQGLLGAKYYANAPLYPLNKSLANINMDALNTWGRTKDIVVVGFGNSTLDDVLAQAAAHQGRVTAPDPEPEKGFFYRSDHFEFAKQGVPALDIDEGTDYIGKPAGYGQQKRAEYTNNNYHKPSDEVKPDWDLSGMAEDVQLLFMVGYTVIQGDRWPEWKAGTEFKAKREHSLRTP